VSKKIIKIYLAGPLFGVADRVHNLQLECELGALGYEVLLPQRRAKPLLADGDFNIVAVREDCANCATDPEVIYVGNVDGADADAGTAIEYGLVMKTSRRAVIYRTDFRTDRQKEIGICAMFGLGNTKLVYHPCYITELEEIQPFYQELAQKIHEAILSYE
jgi:nucleoside 2-deoxyribosyltransferase